jgi:protein-disulfide isomerase
MCKTPAYVLLLVSSSIGLAADRCVPITAVQRTTLEKYVRAKYKVAAPGALEITETAAAPNTCFRKIDIKQSGESKKKFHLTVYASPDLRFLAPQLLDTSVDPVQEERQRAEAFRVGLNGDGSPSTGPSNAPVTITVFSDFQCPYCAGLARTLRQEVLPNERNTVRLVFRYYPLDMHAWARKAAQAEVCANEQSGDLFWKLHDYIFENQRGFTPDNVIEKITQQAASFQKIDKPRFAACIDDKKTAAKIERDVAFGTANGVHETPTLFVNGQRADVANAPEQIRSLIREASSSR